jgi:glycosyltransferase involved in cell wall biosynthesis
MGRGILPLSIFIWEIEVTKHRIGVVLYGTPKKSHRHEDRISGLELWQASYVEKLANADFDLFEYYFESGSAYTLKVVNDRQFVVTIPPESNFFYFQSEANKHDLIYPVQAAHLEKVMVDTFSSHKIDAIFVINWIVPGMAIWQALLTYNKRVFFTPTEHSLICHMGFLLEADGKTCGGPGDGTKCHRCTHGDISARPLLLTQPWYSERWRQFYSWNRFLPTAMKSRFAIFMAKLVKPKSSLLSENEGSARIESVKRLLDFEKLTVLYQSERQHKVFERAVGKSLPVDLPMVITENRQLYYDRDQDFRAQAKKLVFMFAARSSYDRGLSLLLEAWKLWAPCKNDASLVIRTGDLPANIRKELSFLEKDFDVDVATGQMTDKVLSAEFHRTHFLVNPTLWEEPLAGSVIEGFSIGVPAIVPSRTGSSSFVVQGENGYIFEFGSAESLANCMRTAMERGRKHWLEMSNASFRSSNTYKNAVEKQFDEMESLIESSP